MMREPHDPVVRGNDTAGMVAADEAPVAAARELGHRVVVGPPGSVRDTSVLARPDAGRDCGAGAAAAPAPPRVVRCDYCQHHAQLVDSAELYGGRSFGYVWLCRPCDAYVGVHKNSATYQPLGRLANGELRAWKKRAHSIFDLLWKTPNGMGRHDAYRELQYAMQMDAATAHIGMFDVEQCRRTVRYFEVFTPAFLRTRNTSTARRAVVDAGRFGHAGDPV